MSTFVPAYLSQAALQDLWKFVHAVAQFTVVHAEPPGPCHKPHPGSCDHCKFEYEVWPNLFTEVEQ